MGWFRVESGGAACTLVLVYVSIRLSESVSLGQYREIQQSGHDTTQVKSLVNKIRQ